MPVVDRQAIVPYSPAQMFALVADIAAYPEFLPWCHGSEVLEATPEKVRASLTIGKSGVHKTFTTENTLTLNQSMEMRLLDGPFSHLYGLWSFEVTGSGKTRVKVHIEFEFKHHWAAVAFKSVLSQAARQLVQAFSKRAKEVYGA